MGDSGFSETTGGFQADKIDMSLDEIIELNKKEQDAGRAGIRARNRRAANRSNVLKSLNETPESQRGIRKGPIRSRGTNRSRGLRRQSGLSLLNRANTKTVELHVGHTASPRRSFRGRGRGRGRGGLSRGAFSATPQRVPETGPRPLVLDRGFSATGGSGNLERYLKIKRQGNTPTSRTTLKVSLSNAKSPPVTRVRTGGKVIRGRSAGPVGSRPSPKGIPLRFNYKATTNQTRLSLNERFTSLRSRGRGLGFNRGSGRGRERGRGRGRGRGGARGSARGSRRTVFLQ